MRKTKKKSNKRMNNKSKKRVKYNILRKKIKKTLGGAVSGRVKGDDLISGKLYKITINISPDGNVYNPPLITLAYKTGTFLFSILERTTYNFINIMPIELRDERWKDYRWGTMPRYVFGYDGDDEVERNKNLDAFLHGKHGIKAEEAPFSVDEFVKDENNNLIQNYFEEVIPTLSNLALPVHIKKIEEKGQSDDEKKIFDSIKEQILPTEIRHNINT